MSTAFEPALGWDNCKTKRSVALCQAFLRSLEPRLMGSGLTYFLTPSYMQPAAQSRPLSKASSLLLVAKSSNPQAKLDTRRLVEGIKLKIMGWAISLGPAAVGANRQFYFFVIRALNELQ